MAKKIEKRIQDLIQEYKKNLKQNNIPWEKMIIFGSYAKGTQHKWSDIDLAVVSKSFGKDLHSEYTKLYNLVPDTTDNASIEPHPINPQDLKNPYLSLSKEILQHGIAL